MNNQETTLPIAVQLYTLREMPGDLDSTLAQVTAAGFTAVETVGDHGLTAAQMQELLDKHNLQIVSTHIALDTLQTNMAKIIAFNQAVGNDTLVVPYVQALREATDAAVYREYGRLLDQLGQRCRAEGMHLLYHNHDWELAMFDGRRGIDWLLDSGDPANLGFEADLGWIANVGVEPAEILQHYAGRCSHVHVKDLAAPGERPEDALREGVVLADVGHGRIQWPPILTAAHVAGTRWYIVEHDNPRDPIATISRSYEYLQSQLPAILQA